MVFRLHPGCRGGLVACRHLAPGSVSRVTSQPVGGVASARRGPCPSRAGPWGRGVPRVADRGHAAPGSTGCLRCPAVSQPCSDSGSNTSPVPLAWPCQVRGPARWVLGQAQPLVRRRAGCDGGDPDVGDQLGPWGWERSRGGATGQVLKDNWELRLQVGGMRGDDDQAQGQEAWGEPEERMRGEEGGSGVARLRLERDELRWGRFDTQNPVFLPCPSPEGRPRWKWLEGWERAAW